MTQWKLTLSYDGTPFHGWQVQPDRATVQGKLSEVIARITGERVLPQGSGRTDAGVHALAQVASFALDSPIPPANLLRALNRSLPPSIRVLSAEIAALNFHARHSALGKTYEYRIFERKGLDRRIQAASTPKPGGPFMRRTLSHESGGDAGPADPDRICPPFLAPFVWDCRWPLDLEPMQRAAALLLGTHDFTSFAAADPDLTTRAHEEATSPGGPFIDSFIVDQWGTTAASPTTSAPNPIKTLSASTVLRENDLLLYRVTGSGFLHHMVRNIVGTLVEIGRGSLAVESIPTILAKKDRTVAGPTAPACGLFLVSVDYAPPAATLNPEGRP